MPSQVKNEGRQINPKFHLLPKNQFSGTQHPNVYPVPDVTENDSTITVGKAQDTYVRTDINLNPIADYRKDDNDLWVQITKQNPFPLYSMNGLRITWSPTQQTEGAFTVQSGSIRDSTDSVNLYLPSTTVFQLDKLFGVAGTFGTGAVIASTRAGTISTSIITVTGTSTVFLSDFSPTAINTDINSQLVAAGSVVGFTSYSDASIIAAGTNTARVSTVTNDTSLTTSLALGVGAGTAYTRGGIVRINDQLSYVIMLMLNDSDGTVQIGASSLTVSGLPDLPPGYTFFRAIGIVKAWKPAGFQPVRIIQPLLPDAGVQNPKAIWAGQITPTLYGSNVTAVNTTTGLITVAGSLAAAGIVTGMSIVVTGATPTGITAGTGYYVNVQSNTTLFLYTTQMLAFTDLSRVIPSTATTGWSFRYFTYSGIGGFGTPVSFNFDSLTPVGAYAGTTNMQYDLNLVRPITANSAAFTVFVDNIFGTDAAIHHNWILNFVPNSITSLEIAFNTVNSFMTATTGVGQGAWSQQGVNPFQMSIVVWSNE